MFSKILVFTVILAAANAGELPKHATSSQNIVRHDEPVHTIHHEGSHYAHDSHGHYDDHDSYAHPKYEFSYSVADPHTGDHKAHHETRDGGAVHGYYTVAQPDGTFHKVTYTADDHSGFHAVVTNTGVAKHPIPHGHGYH